MFARTVLWCIHLAIFTTMMHHSNSVCVAQKSPGEITALPFEMEIGPFKNAQQMWRRTPVSSAHLMKEQWIYFGNVRFTCMERRSETRMLAFIKPAVILATNICCLSFWHSHWMCMLCYSNEKLWHLYKLMQGNAWTDGSNLKPRPCGTVAPDVVQPAPSKVFYSITS